MAGVTKLQNRTQKNFYFEKEQLDQLAEYSKESGVPQSQVVRFALRDYLKKHAN